MDEEERMKTTEYPIHGNKTTTEINVLDDGTYYVIHTFESYRGNSEYDIEREEIVLDGYGEDYDEVVMRVLGEMIQLLNEYPEGDIFSSRQSISDIINEDFKRRGRLN